jgi:hypothetical protein
MEKFNERFPFQLFLDAWPNQASESNAGRDPLSVGIYTPEAIATLKTSYQTLWDTFAHYTKTARPDRLKHKIRVANYVHSVELATGSAMFLQCKIVNHRPELSIETRINHAHFRGTAGFVLGNKPRNYYSTHPNVHQPAMTILDTAHLLHVAQHLGPVFYSHAADLLGGLSVTPAEAEHASKWVEDTQKIIAVPEISLVETTEWLRSINHEIAAEREASSSKSSAQNDDFMRLFASLANPRVGA